MDQKGRNPATTSRNQGVPQASSLLKLATPLIGQLASWNPGAAGLASSGGPGGDSCTVFWESFHYSLSGEELQHLSPDDIVDSLLSAGRFEEGLHYRTMATAGGREKEAGPMRSAFEAGGREKEARPMRSAFEAGGREKEAGPMRSAFEAGSREKEARPMRSAFKVAGREKEAGPSRKRPGQGVGF
ncbi:hypothetical protein EYF80_049958 [Liparis tanakae]|uniref:Uncharacterized protein n=1 Tax=Liparis tanakae TaxID=230148 RepID=A0A4Z2FFD7_9TELE|nr:hypothetical protein EYF80_049958 [Liparis tanakae]